MAAEILVSVIIPARNESRTIAEVVRRVVASVPSPCEVIVVDDGSTDATSDEVSKVAAQHDAVRLLRRERNGGKGVALRDGIKVARGRVIVFQDADLELDPSLLPDLLAPVLAGTAEACYGSRFLSGGARVPRRTRWANRILTAVTNLIYGTDLTDMETGQKAFAATLLRSLPLEGRRYEIEPELAALIAVRGARIREVPVTYRPRGHSHGKRIGARDGWEAIRTLVTLRFRTWPHGR